MGNKCTKASKRVSPETLPAPKPLRWRFFQAVGLGKCCATEDIQQETGTETGHASPVVAQSVSDLTKADIDVLYYDSSLSCMPDNEDLEGYSNKKDVAPETEAQALLSSHKVSYESQNEATTEASDIADVDTVDYHEKEIASEEKKEKSVDDTVIDTVKRGNENRDEINGKDINGTDDASPTKTTLNKDIYYRKAEDDKHQTDVDDTPHKEDSEYDRERDQTTHAENVETASNLKMTSSDSSASTDDGVPQQKTLCPTFYSAGSANVYQGFSGGKEDEVDEEIEVEVDHNEALKNDQPVSVDKFHLKIARKIARTSGGGEVSLPDMEIMAAKARLAFLRQGLDPDMDSNDTQIGTCIPKHDANKEDDCDQSFQPTEHDIIHGPDPGNPMEDSEKDINCDKRMTIKKDDIYPGRETTKANVDTNASQKDIIKCHNIAHKTGGIGVASIQERLRSPSRSFSETEGTARGSNTIGSFELGLSGSEGHINNELDDNTLSDTSIKSSISLAIAFSLESIKSHSSRSDCIMSFYVRSPHFELKPRKVEVRASAKQVKDGLVEKHLNLLKNIHLPAKPVCQVPLTEKKSKRHLFATPSLADIHHQTNHKRWTQKQGRTDHVKLHSVPTFYESTEKTLNARERSGLDKLRKYRIGLQCKEIERIKVDSDEFPGVLPPKIRAKWKKKMEEKRHIN